jgi:citrate lyase beta subunit
MHTTLNDADLADVHARLAEAGRRVAGAYPGERPDRQPVHTVYGGAQLFSSDLAVRLGEAARRAFAEHAPDPETFAGAIGLGGDAAFRRTVHGRVAAKLEREPVEDFRIDFEDGYGHRPDAEEDGHAVAGAEAMAKGHAEGTLPPWCGIRIKPLTGELGARSLRTLDLFLTTLAHAERGGDAGRGRGADLGGGGGRGGEPRHPGDAGRAAALPPNFCVTLPKITAAEQVAALVDVLERLEARLGLPAGAVPVELMVETTQTIVGPDGRIALPGFVAAGRGRVRGAHFGTYDYTAGCGISARHQAPQHPACDFARHVMQASLAGTGVTLSDGATTVMPVGPHRGVDSAALTAAEHAENRAAIHHAWRLHYEDVRSSLRHGFHQGWDLHPAQLPTRYAAVFSFFLEARDEAGARLRAFVEKAAQATLLGSVFDDAATGQGLLTFFLRGLSCGAITENEALATGLTLDELRGRSFVRMLEGRRRAARG